MFLTNGGRVQAVDGDVVRMTAVVGSLTPQAVAAVYQRRLGTMAIQAVKPHSAGAGTEVVADGMTMLSTYHHHHHRHCHPRNLVI